MNIFEFILILVGMLIVGMLALIIVSKKCGLIDDISDDKPVKNKKNKE